MSSRYFMLYLIAAIIATIVVVYEVFSTYPDINTGKLAISAIIDVFFYYLAFKTYHEKKDKELM